MIPTSIAIVKSGAETETVSVIFFHPRTTIFIRHNLKKLLFNIFEPIVKCNVNKSQTHVKVLSNRINWIIDSFLLNTVYVYEYKD